MSLNSCRKEALYNGSEPVLQFSDPVLTFDTVFTTLGTVTRYFRVENPLNTSVLIEEINLKNLDQRSTFRINVNGTPATSVENIEILANDYIYIFVEATVDPTAGDLPFIIQDEIEYKYNGQTQTSKLQVWGQNAYFHKGEIYYNEHVVWQNDLPHVVLSGSGFPGVGVDSFSTLTILPGCEIYTGFGAGIYVDGQLLVGQQGSEEAVTFESTRIEDLPNEITFEDNPGLWTGIVLFSGSKGSFYNTSINQATWGIQGRHSSEDIYDMLVNSARPEIVLDKVQIKNSSLNAFLAINSDVTVTNSIFYNSGSNLVGIALGGKVKFDNCTLSNNGVSNSDDSEDLILSNYVQTSKGTGVHHLESADFTNCIIHSSEDEQIIFATDPQADFNYSFSNCLLKTKLISEPTFIDCIFNEDPLFESTADADFHLKDNSPCIGTGKDNGISEDLFFNNRNTFDIGAVAY